MLTVSLFGLHERINIKVLSVIIVVFICVYS